MNKRVLILGVVLLAALLVLGGAPQAMAQEITALRAVAPAAAALTDLQASVRDVMALELVAPELAAPRGAPEEAVAQETGGYVLVRTVGAAPAGGQYVLSHPAPQGLEGTGTPCCCMFLPCARR